MKLPIASLLLYCYIRLIITVTVTVTVAASTVITATPSLHSSSAMTTQSNGPTLPVSTLTPTDAPLDATPSPSPFSPETLTPFAPITMEPTVAPTSSQPYPFPTQSTCPTATNGPATAITTTPPSMASATSTAPTTTNNVVASISPSTSTTLPPSVATAPSMMTLTSSLAPTTASISSLPTASSTSPTTLPSQSPAPSMVPSITASPSVSFSPSLNPSIGPTCSPSVTLTPSSKPTESTPSTATIITASPSLVPSVKHPSSTHFPSQTPSLHSRPIVTIAPLPSEVPSSQPSSRPTLTPTLAAQTAVLIIGTLQFSGSNVSFNSFTASDGADLTLSALQLHLWPYIASTDVKITFIGIAYPNDDSNLGLVGSPSLSSSSSPSSSGPSSASSSAIPSSNSVGPSFSSSVSPGSNGSSSSSPSSASSYTRPGSSNPSSISKFKSLNSLHSFGSSIASQVLSVGWSLKFVAQRLGYRNVSKAATDVTAILQTNVNNGNISRSMVALALAKNPVGANIPLYTIKLTSVSVSTSVLHSAAASISKAPATGVHAGSTYIPSVRPTSSAPSAYGASTSILTTTVTTGDLIGAIFGAAIGSALLSGLLVYACVQKSQSEPNKRERRNGSHGDGSAALELSEVYQAHKSIAYNNVDEESPIENKSRKLPLSASWSAPNKRSTTNTSAQQSGNYKNTNDNRSPRLASPSANNTLLASKTNEDLAKSQSDRPTSPTAGRMPPPPSMPPPPPLLKKLSKALPPPQGSRPSNNIDTGRQSPPYTKVERQYT